MLNEKIYNLSEAVEKTDIYRVAIWRACQDYDRSNCREGLPHERFKIGPKKFAYLIKASDLAVFEEKFNEKKLKKARKMIKEANR